MHNLALVLRQVGRNFWVLYKQTKRGGNAKRESKKS